MGLNNHIDPHVVPHNPETAASDMAVAVNVEIDRALKVTRCTGYSQIISASDSSYNRGGFHSIWSDNGPCYVGKGSSLYEFTRDQSLIGIRSGMSGKRISFARIGQSTLYCNGVENGMLKYAVSYPWPTHEYTGPESNKEWDAAPIGEKVAILSGRAYLVVGNTIYWSEPYQYGLFNLARNHRMFDSRVLMMVPTTNGMYISTETVTAFLGGLNPHEFTYREIYKHPAFEWSEAVGQTSGNRIGLESNAKVRFWRDHKGVIAGLPDGSTFNMTELKILSPECGGYGATLLRGSQLISTIGV